MSWTSNGGGNAAPKTSAVNDTATVSEGGGKVTIDVLANDVATTKTLYSVEQGNNRQSLTDTTDKGATISIVGGKLVYDVSTSIQAQALAVGETMTDTFTYVVVLDGGKKDEATVTVTITGANDAPILAPDLFGPHRLTEVSGVTGGSAVLSNSGVLLFGDIDVKDTHTVSSTLLSSELSRGTIPVATQQQLAGALTTAMQIDSTFLPGGSLTYKFALADKAVDFLGAGDTLKLTYNLTVSDGHGGTSTQPVTFIITGTADAVVVTRPPAAPIGEGGVSTVDAFTGISNVEGYTLTATGLPASLPAGMTYNPSTHSFVFDSNNAAYNHLAAGQTQTVSVTYGVSNGTSTVNQTLTWTVTGTNDAPIVAAPVTGAAGAAGGIVSLNALAGASDLDDGATLSVVNVPGTLPAGMTYDAATKTFKLDPANAAYSHLGAGQTQTVTVSYGVSDGTATTAQTATFTVTGVNDAPKVTSAVTAGSSQTGAVQTVDALAGASDVDDGATLSVVNVPGALPAGVTYDAATHSFKLDASNPAYAHLPAGATQAITISYGVSDGTATTPQTLTWTVTGTNDAPKVAQALTGAAADNGAVSTVDALAGASDADDGAALSVANLPATLPAGVTYDAATHSFTLDPANAAFDHLAAGQTQTVSVSFGVSDGTVTTPQTITWTVTGSNDAPVVASALSGAAADNGAVSTINALSGASDADDGSSLSVVDVPSTLPAGVTYDAATKTFSLNGSNVAYDHLAAGQTQTVTVSFGVSDGTVTTPQTVTWTVTGANDAPVVAAALTGAAADGGAVSTIDALAGASDVDDGATLSVVNVPGALPAGVTYNAATHSFSLDGSVTAYDHLAAGQTQQVSVTFGVSDGTTTTAQTVTWTVTGANDAPVVTAALSGAAADNGAVSTINALSGASDVDDGTSLSVVGVPTTLPAGVTYDAATNTFSLDGSVAAYDHLAAGQTQTVTVSFGVSDGTVTTPQTVTWTVTGANDAPVVAGALTGAAADNGAVSTVDALAGASDVDDGTTLSVVGMPTTMPAGVTYDAATHSFTLDPANPAFDHLAAGQTQSVAVSFGVSDGTTTTPQTVTWTVTGSNDAPTVGVSLTGAAADNGAVSKVDALSGASDVDDGATLSVVGVPTTLPPGVSYDAATHSFSLNGSVAAYDHLAAGQTQQVSVSFGVSDGVATTAQTITWTVTGANDAPVVAAALKGAAAEGAVVTVGALSGATDVDDGTTLTVVVPADLPAGVTYDAVAKTFSLDATNGAYNHIGAGQSLVFAVTFGISDGTVTTPQAVIFTVTGANDAPVVAAALSGAAAEGGAVSTVDALAGASDVDDLTSLTVVGVPTTLPPGVSYDAATHSFSLDASVAAYNHLAAGATQQISVSFGVSDGVATTAQTITWTVTGANDAPVVAAALKGAAAEGAVVTVGALSGATDVDDGTTLTVVGVPADLPAGVTYDAVAKTFSLDATNGAYNHIGAGQSLVFAVTLGISDGTVTTPQAVIFTVTGANDAPVVAAALSGAAAEGGAVSTLDALAGASDVDDLTSLTVVGVPTTLPPGVSYDAATHSFSLDASVAAYNHLAAGATQQVSVSFGVSDGVATTAQTITWTVTGANDAPAVSAVVAGTLAEGQVSNLGALTGATDLDDGAVLSVVNVPTTLPPGVTYDAATKVFSFDAGNAAYNHLAQGASQVVSVGYGVTDGTATTNQVVQWTVVGSNDAPVATPVSYASAEGSGVLTSGAFAGVTDADDATFFQVTAGGLPAGVTYDSTTALFSLDANDAAYNSLAVGETKLVSFQYRVADQFGGSVIQTANWTVTGVNDAFTLGAPIALTLTEDAPVQTVQLLAGAVDPDATDVLSLALKADGVTPDVTAGVVATGTTWTTPVAYTVTKAGALTVDPNQFNGLQLGEQVKVTFNYTVTDGHGASTATTSSMIFTGVNDAPTPGGDALPNNPSADVYASAYTALANATNGFAASTTHTAYGQVVIADMNGDGYLDAIAMSGATTVVVLRNDGAGNLISAYTGSVAAASSVMDLQVGDLDNNGLQDIFVASGTGAHITLMNRGGFTFTSTTAVTGTAAGISTNRVALADFNGDGKMDLALTNTTGTAPQIAFLVGDGAGHFLTPIKVPMPGTGTTAAYAGDIGFADLNGDGKIDAFAVAGYDTSYVYFDDAPPWASTVMLGNGTGGFTVAQSLTVDNGASVALGDVNGDGKIDAVVGAVFTTKTTGSGNVITGGHSQVWLNDGTGHFTAGSILTSTGGALATAPVDTVQLRDLDGDGDLDLIAAGSSNTTTWTNNGAGVFTLTNTLAAARDVALGDLDLKSINASKVFPINVSTVLANDTDIDGDTLTVTTVSGHSALGAKVTLVGGTINYDPTYAEAIQALGQGARLADTFTYTVSDGHGGSTTATVSLNVYGMGGAWVGTAGGDTMTQPSAGGLTVLGMAGNDSMGGSNTSDVLIGGAGNDTLTGSNGADQFVFGPGFGHDVVTDYLDGTDKLVFDTRVFADSADVLAHALQSGSNVIITDALGNSVQVNNLLLSNLTASDFLFV